MSELPRKAAARTARLAALPLGFAGRSALGFGKRLGGASADAVLADVQARTAQQIFRTLGELKGGAMKVGQAMSIMEGAFPEEWMAPFRADLTRLQDSAPPMPTQTVREVIAAGLGPDWQEKLVWLDGGPTAAASIGQVHKGRWHDGREVAVKVQYPGAGDALRSDLRQLAVLARTVDPMLPGADLKPLVTEVHARIEDELNYELEAESQRLFAKAFADDPDIVVPDVVAVGDAVLVTEWLDSTASLASIIKDGTPEERDHYGELYLRFVFAGPSRAGMIHADPHPGNYRIIPAPDGSPGQLGVLDFGAVARVDDPETLAVTGRAVRLAVDRDAEGLTEHLRTHGFIRDHIRADPKLVLDTLVPMVEYAEVERYRFTRAYLREQFNRVNNPRDPAFGTVIRMNLPPEHAMLHRTWVGAGGVLTQLNAEVPIRAMIAEYVPGFAA